MSNSYQHVIPQAYLRGFGFKKFNTKWFVSVKNIEKNIWEDREIRRFLGEKGIYTLNRTRNISKLIIEKNLNGGIEKRMGTIIKQLNRKEDLTANIHLALAETTANLFCRNHMVRKWIKNWLKRDNLRDFFNHIISSVPQALNKQEEIFLMINSLPVKDKINNYMVFYMNYVSALLQSMSLEVINGNGLIFTSDNPVCIMGEGGFGELEKNDTKFYFPLSSNYLIHFHRVTDTTITREYVETSKELYDHFHMTVLPKWADKFIISPLNKVELNR